MGYVRYTEGTKRRLVRECQISDKSLADFARTHRVSVGSSQKLCGVLNYADKGEVFANGRLENEGMADRRHGRHVRIITGLSESGVARRQVSLLVVGPWEAGAFRECGASFPGLLRCRGEWYSDSHGRATRRLLRAPRLLGANASLLCGGRYAEKFSASSKTASAQRLGEHASATDKRLRSV